MLGELKFSIKDKKGMLLQMERYVRDDLSYQPMRRCVSRVYNPMEDLDA